MTFKNILTTEMKDKNKLVKLRYESSKIVFIFATILFFVSFFLHGAGLFTDFLSRIFGTLYVLFLLSFLIYVYFLIKRFFAEKLGNFIYLVILILIVLFVFFVLPVFIRGGIFGLFE